ncbi:eCIS core domain-containing protein [Deinococcus arcticus]|uniref:eCIS core domain-containing protein n=1 Tax=Deinococcus arcticus TaxID=2136176 RepID=UPI001304AA5B|nr:DUF4157 domain-containing protein [Deinococcus arcticus]
MAALPSPELPAPVRPSPMRPGPEPQAVRPDGRAADPSPSPQGQRPVRPPSEAAEARPVAPPTQAPRATRLDRPAPLVPRPAAPSRLGLPRAARPPTETALEEALDTALHRDGHGQPLAPSARAALAQTLGRAVDDVRVVQNVHVPAALKIARADGLTVGRTVFLAPDTRVDTPAGFALAAHEATHAIRHDQPTFVPQVLRRAGPGPTPQDEEAVALGTEHAVAREQRQTPPAPSAARLPGLPAPWEPMPGWDDPVGAPRPAAPGPRAEPLASSPPSLPAAPPPQPSVPAWAHAAASDRPHPGSPPPAAPASTPAVGRRVTAAPQVDLDQVAREIYARLRDRLGDELRRL